jgi:HEAT repeat protein
MTVRNFRYTVTYLKPKQHEQLNKIKETIKDKNGISVSLAELIRDSVDDFLSKNKTEEDLEAYLEYKGW